jgi:hypothetical protein
MPAPCLRIGPRPHEAVFFQALDQSTHRSTQALEKDIRDWIKNWNENPRPFVWTKTADEILERLASYLQRIPGAGH